MYDCINEANEYLKNKYGYKIVGLTAKAINQLSKARSKKEREETINSLTGRDYYFLINPATEEKDKVIELLISQYYYGIEAKKELHYKLIEYGVLNAPEDTTELVRDFKI